MEVVLKNGHGIALSHKCFVKFVGSEHILIAPFFFLVRTSWLTNRVSFSTDSMIPSLIFSMLQCIPPHLLSTTTGIASGLSCGAVTPANLPR